MKLSNSCFPESDDHDDIFNFCIHSFFSPAPETLILTSPHSRTVQAAVPTGSLTRPRLPVREIFCEKSVSLILKHPVGSLLDCWDETCEGRSLAGGGECDFEWWSAIRCWLLLLLLLVLGGKALGSDDDVAVECSTWDKRACPWSLSCVAWSLLTLWSWRDSLELDEGDKLDRRDLCSS